MIRSYAHRISIRSLVLAGAVLAAGIGSAKADSFIASPQDYPTPAAYAAAYAAAGQEGAVQIMDKVFNPNAFGVGKNTAVMTPIERKWYADHLSNFGGSDSTD